MYIPKRYGESKIDSCPFCGKVSVTKNSQGVPVCTNHRTGELKDLKCACGSWLDLNTGKFGAYFRCGNCGNINLKKALEMNPQIRAGTTEKKDSQKDSQKIDRDDTRPSFSASKAALKIKPNPSPRETTVTSDELDYLY